MRYGIVLVWLGLGHGSKRAVQRRDKDYERKGCWKRDTDKGQLSWCRMARREEEIERTETPPKRENRHDSASWAMPERGRLLGWLVKRRWNQFKVAVCELEGVPTSVRLTVLLTMLTQASPVHFAVNPLVVFSDGMDCDRTGDGGSVSSSSCCCCRVSRLRL
jgi:hypothetical protein